MPTTWKEPGPVLRGTLIVLPGRGESASVYERFGRRLAVDAYRVHVLDGTTDGELDAVLAEADQAAPVVVVGSDAGAAYAAHLAATGRLPGVAALILAGLPATADGTAALDWAGELAARTGCPTHAAKISESGVRPAQLFTALSESWFGPARIDLPVLGLHGQDDTISPLASARAFYAAVPRAELVGIAGGRHDVLNDQTHRTVAATVVLFLERLRNGAGLTPIAVPEPLTAERIPA